MEESNILVTVFVSGLVLICIRYLTKYIIKYYNESDSQDKTEVSDKKKGEEKKGSANGSSKFFFKFI